MSPSCKNVCQMMSLEINLINQDSAIQERHPRRLSLSHREAHSRRNEYASACSITIREGSAGDMSLDNPHTAVVFFFSFGFLFERWA
jgi:hypothetical protein